jgi:hypothetical protein
MVDPLVAFIKGEIFSDFATIKELVKSGYYFFQALSGMIY